MEHEAELLLFVGACLFGVYMCCIAGAPWAAAVALVVCSSAVALT